MVSESPGILPDPSAWTSLVEQFDELKKQVNLHRATTIGKQSTRDQARALVQQYFRFTRPHLGVLGFTNEELVPLDSAMQDLLRLANSISPKASYAAAIRTGRRELSQIELIREMRLGTTSAARTSRDNKPSSIEQAIIDTLEALLPGAALGYRQALRDIADDERHSYRGVAAELREVVREVLDRLVSDDDLKSAGVAIESGQNGYTQKQKVRLLLKSRGLSDNARKAPEESVRLVDELTASLTRSVYVRGSISTHVTSPVEEVRQLKLYVDGVLGELLEIHRRRV